MKRLLLAAFLLCAGMITTENVAANKLTQQSELKKAPQPPAAVLQAFAADVAAFESTGYTRVVNVTWTFIKGKFRASFYFLNTDTGVTEGPYGATYNRQGQRV